MNLIETRRRRARALYLIFNLVTVLGQKLRRKPVELPRKPLGWLC